MSKALPIHLAVFRVFSVFQHGKPPFLRASSVFRQVFRVFRAVFLKFRRASGR